MRWIHADVLQWEPDTAFDVVTSFGAFGHFVPRDQPALAGPGVPGAEARRTLRVRDLAVAGAAPPVWWMARGFNAAMRVRNLVAPPFVMYYLTFSLPEASSDASPPGSSRR